MRFVGTSLDDHFTGTSNPDTFEMNSAGNDTVSGNEGDDVFYFGHYYTDQDVISGGPGFDVLRLKGNYLSAYPNFSNTSGIEELKLAGGHTYRFDMGGSPIAPGDRMIVDGHALKSGDSLAFFGAHIGGGSMVALYGGHGDDLLQGGTGRDLLVGGEGQDMLVGDAVSADAKSNDRFVFNGVSDSTVDRPDTVEWDPETGDRIDLHKIDADSNVSGDQGFTFIGTASFSDTAGELRYEASGGGYLISGDVNGDGVADFAIQADANLHALPALLTGSEFFL